MKGDYSSNQMDVEERVFEIKRRAGAVLIASLEDLAVNDSVDENILAIRNNTHKYLPEADSELEQELNTLRSEEDKEQFIAKAADIIIRLIATHLSLEELERRIMSFSIEEHGQQELVRGLTFDVYEDAIFLHVPLTFFNNPAEAVESFIEGLKVLAVKLKNDSNLKNITEVVGHSDLVKNKHSIATKLGFTVTKDENGRPSHEAKMSKERLLELYG